MRSGLVSLCALLAIAGAQGARALARDQEATIEPAPYAPSPGAAPFVSLGYREVAADLLFFRVVGYFGGRDYTSDGVASLLEAIEALDPHFRKIYEWGGLAILLAAHKDKDGNPAILRAIALLEHGSKLFPDDYKMPEIAGEAYILDLQTKDDAQKRTWERKGMRLLEAAVRKPDAPAKSATWIAELHSRLGEKQRAIDGLREMLLITSDDQARQEILDKLAKLENADSTELAAEILEHRRAFETAWKHDRPYMSPSLYILVGPREKPGFDMTDLATGGRDLVGAHVDWDDATSRDP